MNPLGTRKLGSAPLHATQLGFGGAPLGDIYARLDEAEATGAVAAAPPCRRHPVRHPRRFTAMA